MFKETKERQSGPAYSPRSGMPVVAKSASSTGRIRVAAAPARAGAPPGRRWGLFAGLGLGVAATIAAFVVMGGGGTREDEPRSTGAAAPSRDELRRKAAADAIRKARDFTQANGSDVDRAVTLWQEAVFAADATPYLADARREHEAAQARQKDVVGKELAELAEKVRTLAEKEDFKAAQEAVDALRSRHPTAEWIVEVTRTAGAIPERAAKALAPLKEQAAAGRAMNSPRRSSAPGSPDGDSPRASPTSTRPWPGWPLPRRSRTRPWSPAGTSTKGTARPSRTPRDMGMGPPCPARPGRRQNSARDCTSTASSRSWRSPPHRN